MTDTRPPLTAAELAGVRADVAYKRTVNIYEFGTERLLATIEQGEREAVALRARVAELEEDAEEWRAVGASADLETAKLYREYEELEGEASTLREKLWHHHQAVGLETDPHHCRLCQDAEGARALGEATE